MRYLTDAAMLELGAGELAALAADTPRGSFAPAVFSALPSDLEGFDALADDVRAATRAAVASLAAAERRLDLQVTVADESIRRLSVVPIDDERLAVLASVGTGYLLGTQSPSVLTSLITEVLGASDLLRRFDVAADAGAAGTVLALVAIADAFRLERLRSMIGHTEPPRSVSVDEVAARIADAKVEDFRWPLNLLEKVLPADPAEVLDQAGLDRALAALEAGSVIAITAADPPLPAIVTPGGLGELVIDAVVHEVSKVAATLLTGDGAETHLAVRGPHSAWLFSMTAGAGTISDLGGPSTHAFADDLLDRLGSAPEAAVPPDVPPPPPPPPPE